MSIIRSNLFQSVFERVPFPLVLKTVEIHGRAIFDAIEWENTINVKNTVFSIRLKSDYISLEPNHALKIKRVLQHNWGYAIYLKDLKTIDQFLEKQFKSKKRSIIRRYINRLEKCLTIRYKIYWGDIEELTYELLMATLQKMISKRFDEKGEHHQEMKRWDELKQRTFSQIKKKQASLFVIYDDGLPIEISLNYHLGEVLFSSISSYDMDYSKFGLGHVEIYKQLEWCLQNGYHTFEMGVGGMDYKARWSNYIYQFEHVVLHQDTTLTSRLFGNYEYHRIRLKEYLKSKKINELKDRLTSFYKFKGFANENSKQLDFTFELLSHAPNESSLVKQTYQCLLDKGFKKPFNDLLYKYSCPKSTVHIYEPLSLEGLVLNIEGQWIRVFSNPTK